MSVNRDDVEHAVWMGMPAPRVKNIREIVDYVDAVMAAVDEYVLGVCGWSEARRARLLREAAPQAEAGQIL